MPSSLRSYLTSSTSRLISYQLLYSNETRSLLGLAGLTQRFESVLKKLLVQETHHLVCQRDACLQTHGNSFDDTNAFVRNSATTSWFWTSLIFYWQNSLLHIRADQFPTLGAGRGDFPLLNTLNGKVRTCVAKPVNRITFSHDKSKVIQTCLCCSWLRLRRVDTVGCIGLETKTLLNLYIKSTFAMWVETKCLFYHYKGKIYHSLKTKSV
jgi:hypothetical protein